LLTVLIRAGEVVALKTSGVLPVDPTSSAPKVADSIGVLVMEEDKPAIDDLEANFHLDFATLPNPLDEFSPFAGVPPTAAYTICKEGTSFWPDIEKDPWCKVSQRWIPVVSPLDVFLIPLYSCKSTEPFINHIATLQDGFRSYQRIPEEVRKRDKSKDADIALHV
jgi:hypothetical protein